MHTGIGDLDMKLLKIENDHGYFLLNEGQYQTVDKVTKEDILRLINLTLEQEGSELDPYDEVALKNQAEQIVYKSLSRKLIELQSRRQEFIDESERLYLSEYNKYHADI